MIMTYLKHQPQHQSYYWMQTQKIILSFSSLLLLNAEIAIAQTATEDAIAPA